LEKIEAMNIPNMAKQAENLTAPISKQDFLLFTEPI